MSTVSIALLTWNRASVFVKTMDQTLRNAGRIWDELVWTDNGSEQSQLQRMDGFMEQFKVTTKVRHSMNTGMHRGFNTSLCLSRSDYVVLLGPDVLMPDNWLKTFVEYMDKIPHAGIVAMHNVPIHLVPERYRKNREVEEVNGLPVLRAMPFDHFIIRRKIFADVGYWREDFGLYGWADVEWIERCERILPLLGMECFVIPGVHGNHLASDGAEEFKAGVSPETLDYHPWKQSQAALSSNHQILARCRAENFPYYSPF